MKDTARPVRRLGSRCCPPLAQRAFSAERAEAASARFETLAHPVRLALLGMLCRRGGEVCVCDLEAAVPVKQPTVSHHLRLLREAGLVESEKVGQWVYYRIRRDAARAFRGRVEQVLAAFA